MKISEPKDKSFADIATIFASAVQRYWRVALGPALVVLGLSLFYSVRIPDFFRSDFLIFIQPQAINSKIIETPDRIEMGERLEAVVQEILARRSLLKVIDEFNLYPNLRGPLGRELAVRLFRSDLSLEPAESRTGVEINQTFRIAYAHSDPKLAFEVAQALSDLFIEESVVSRRSEMQGTEEFLDAELAEARKRLEVTEEKVQEFVSKNFGKLPEHLTAAVARLENAQTQLSTNSTMITATLARRSNLEAEQKEVLRHGSVAMGNGDGGGADSSDPVERLAQMESALVVLTSRYSDKHPDVLNTKKRIQSLRQQLAGGGSSDKTQAQNSARGALMTRSVRREIRDIDVQLLQLRKENETLKNTIARLELDIQEMPVKEQELLKTRRDYENVKDNYQRLLQAREDAKLQSNLVRSQRATQFRIIERAELPITPSGPNRMLYVGAGVVAGIVLFCLIPLATYFFNSSYKFTSDIEDDLGLSVIGVIPSMPTPASSISQRRVNAMCSVMSLFCFLSGGVAIMWLI